MNFFTKQSKSGVCSDTIGDNIKNLKKGQDTLTQDTLDIQNATKEKREQVDNENKEKFIAQLQNSISIINIAFENAKKEIGELENNIGFDGFSSGIIGKFKSIAKTQGKIIQLYGEIPIEFQKDIENQATVLEGRINNKRNEFGIQKKEG